MASQKEGKYSVFPIRNPIFQRSPTATVVLLFSCIGQLGFLVASLGLDFLLHLKPSHPSGPDQVYGLWPGVGGTPPPLSALRSACWLDCFFLARCR